jgi:tetratricopeptide (TPR) repeat protein
VPLLRRAQGLQEAIVRDNPRVVFYKFTLAFVCRALGRAEEKSGHSTEALAAFERARQLDAAQAEKLFIARYNEACDVTLMARVAPTDRREELVRQAIEILRQAIAQGYRSYAEMSADEDLNILTKRSDFQALLASIRPTDVAPPPRAKEER